MRQGEQGDCGTCRKLRNTRIRIENGGSGRHMKVLVFTSLYPNNVWPNHGVFIKERMTQFAKLDGCEVKVVAPVPYFPAIKINWRWKFSQVARREIRDGIEVYHPRYF